MDAYLRDKLLQKLEKLSDERGYQVLDYVDFLESKYAERPAPSSATPNPLARFADAAAAGKSVANDLMTATNRVVDAASQTVNKPAVGTQPSGTSGASGPGQPGSTGAPVSGDSGDINPS
jgi:hypothetical protein